MIADYEAFISRKLTRVPSTGLAVVPELHASLFPHQVDLTAWALKRGRCAIFADTGLGKTACEIVWADAVARATGKPILILAPLAVGAQTLRESERLEIPNVAQVKYDGDGPSLGARIEITNYDRLHHFDPARYSGVVLDESSIIKNSDSKTLARLIEAFGQTPFKLCASATPSPNDYTELGTHAEFLGVCTKEEMLAEYFCHDGGETQKWRLKGHARKAFWRWVASWGALLRKPSDLGYDDAAYELPPLTMHHHTIAADPEEVKAAGLLFAEPANTLTERRLARKGSLAERVEACAALVNGTPGEPWIVWCHLNAEADALKEAIVGGVEVRGNDEPHVKEGRLIGFTRGDFRVIISKEKIAGFGLNWQHCCHMAFVGPSDSYEMTYQAIRRCWRFGQKRPVDVHIFASELEGNVVANFLRKQEDARKMADELSAETRDALLEEIRGQTRRTNEYAARSLRMPEWLTMREADCE